MWWRMRNAFRVLAGTLERKIYFRYLGIDRRIILKLVLNK
jgi:hypothetical protein